MLQEFIVYRPVLVNRNDVIVRYVGGLFSTKTAVIDVLKTRFGSSKYILPYAGHKWVQVTDEIGTIACAELMYSLQRSGPHVGYISMSVK